MCVPKIFRSRVRESTVCCDAGGGRLHGWREKGFADRQEEGVR